MVLFSAMVFLGRSGGEVPHCIVHPLDLQDMYSSPSILQPSILRSPLIIRLFQRAFSVLNHLYFKTTCNIRPRFLGPMGGLKIEVPLHSIKVPYTIQTFVEIVTLLCLYVHVSACPRAYPSQEARRLWEKWWRIWQGIPTPLSWGQFPKKKKNLKLFWSLEIPMVGKVIDNFFFVYGFIMKCYQNNTNLFLAGISDVQHVNFWPVTLKTSGSAPHLRQ